VGEVKEYDCSEAREDCGEETRDAKSGRLVTPGQVSSVGTPSERTMSSICATSVFPARGGGR
jgi:hypothetical protein